MPLKSSGYLSILSFWQKWGIGAPTNRFPLVWEKSSNGKWLKTAFEKNAHVPVFRSEMIVTQCAFNIAPSRHAFDLRTFLRLTRAVCRSLVVEGSYCWCCCCYCIYLFWVGNPTDSQSTSRVPTRGEKRKRLLLGKCKALWGKPRTLLKLSQQSSTELSCSRFDEERSKKSKAIDEQGWGTVFLGTHQPTHEFDCRTSSGCRCLWGTHVGGHARTRYRVGPRLRLPMRKKENVEERLKQPYSRSQLAPS